MTVRVIPLNDLREHECDIKCWCEPDLDDGVCVHHSLDGRESYEEGRALQ
jgi:hypothetical protein